jgi:hypothetical protein
VGLREKRMRRLLLVATALFLLASSLPAQTAGWVLIIPPMEGPPTWTVLRDAPVSQWDYVKAQDTASACELEKEKALRDVSVILDQWKGNEELRWVSIQIGLRFLASRCIPYELWWGSRK